MLKRQDTGISNFHFKAGMSNQTFAKRDGSSMMNSRNMQNNSIPIIPKTGVSLVKAPTTQTTKPNLRSPSKLSMPKAPVQ